MGARANLTKTVPLGDVASLYITPAAAITFTAATASADYNSFILTGNDLLLAWNTDGANPYTVTISSTPDAQGRTGDITTYSLVAGTIHVFGPFKTARPGWVQTDAKLYIAASNAAIKFAMIQLPG